jgi:hypothetical protein
MFPRDRAEHFVTVWYVQVTMVSVTMVSVTMVSVTVEVGVNIFEPCSDLT